MTRTTGFLAFAKAPNCCSSCPAQPGFLQTAVSWLIADQTPFATNNYFLRQVTHVHSWRRGRVLARKGAMICNKSCPGCRIQASHRKAAAAAAAPLAKSLRASPSRHPHVQTSSSSTSHGQGRLQVRFGTLRHVLVARVRGDLVLPDCVAASLPARPRGEFSPP